ARPEGRPNSPARSTTRPGPCRRGRAWGVSAASAFLRVVRSWGEGRQRSPFSGNTASACRYNEPIWLGRSAPVREGGAAPGAASDQLAHDLGEKLEHVARRATERLVARGAQVDRARKRWTHDAPHAKPGLVPVRIKRRVRDDRRADALGHD